MPVRQTKVRAILIYFFWPLQSAKAIDRAAIQFLGRGNCDVYADYKYGDSFNVRIIPLSGSGYESLNEQKRAAIQALEAADEVLY